MEGETTVQFTTRKELLETCKLVYDRYLTNAAGSNFSARASENTLYITPNQNAKRNKLNMSPDELLHVDMQGNVLEGKGKITSLWHIHRTMFETFDFIGAVIHAHPRMATAFACRKRPMPVQTAQMKKFGEIQVLPEDPILEVEEIAPIIADIFKNTGYGVTARDD